MQKVVKSYAFTQRKQNANIFGQNLKKGIGRRAHLISAGHCVKHFTNISYFMPHDSLRNVLLNHFLQKKKLSFREIK